MQLRSGRQVSSSDDSDSNGNNKRRYRSRPAYPKSRSIRAQRSMDVRLQEQEPPMNDEINGSMLMAPNNSNTLLSTPTSSRSTALARSTSNLQINILATSPQRKQTTPTTALARSASNLQINILATSPQRKQTTPIALRLGPGFDSDQEDECMINEPLDRTTPYNQQEEQQPISERSGHVESFGERPQRLELGIGTVRTAMDDLSDYQDSLMDVNKSVARRFYPAGYGNQAFVDQPMMQAENDDQHDADTEDSDEDDVPMPATPPSSPRPSYSNSNLPGTSAERGRQIKIRGINKAPLTFVARKLNRPMDGPFYMDGPEARRKIMERSHSLPPQTRKSSPNGNNNNNEQDRIELIGRVDKILMNGSLLWHR